MLRKILDRKFDMETSWKLITIIALTYFALNTRVIATAMPLSLIGYKLFSLFGMDFSTFSSFPVSLVENIRLPFLSNPTLVLILGYMLGVWVVSLAKEPYKLVNKLSSKNLIKGILGGFLVGFGVQGIYGANIGEVFGAISMISLSGWIAVIGSSIGLWIGKPLYRWFSKTD